MMLKIRFTQGTYLDGIRRGYKLKRRDICCINISREAFWELAKYKYPIHQIVFSTENAVCGDVLRVMRAVLYR